jgi:hypothetical protein
LSRCTGSPVAMLHGTGMAHGLHSLWRFGHEVVLLRGCKKLAQALPPQQGAQVPCRDSHIMFTPNTTSVRVQKARTWGAGLTVPVGAGTGTLVNYTLHTILYSTLRIPLNHSLYTLCKAYIYGIYWSIDAMIAMHALLWHARGANYMRPAHIRARRKYMRPRRARARLPQIRI